MPGKVVITGASGNIGTALLHLFAEQEPDTEIVAVARRTPPSTHPYGRAQWHNIDLARADAESSLRPIFAGAEAVVHLAIGFQPARNREYLKRTAVEGTRAVVQAAHAAGVGQLVHLSSSGVYSAGAYGDRVTESWPRRGIPTSIYSVDKVAEEDVLDAFESETAPESRPVITRLRPGLIAQHDEATAILRYTLPSYVPRTLTRWIPRLPFLPLDRSLTLPLVHTDDLADAVLKALEHRTQGAFNIAADEPLDADVVRTSFDAHLIPVPAAVLGSIVNVLWDLHLSPVHRGWIDMAYSTPLVDCSRAHTELGWQPHHDAQSIVNEFASGIRGTAHNAGAVLAERSPGDRLRQFISAGPITRRLRP